MLRMYTSACVPRSSPPVRSAPEQNAPPAPVSTSTRSSGRAAISRNVSSSSSAICGLIALRFSGRFEGDGHHSLIACRAALVRPGSSPSRRSYSAAPRLRAGRQVERRWREHLLRRHHDEVVADARFVQRDPRLLRALANAGQRIERTVLERRRRRPAASAWRTRSSKPWKLGPRSVATAMIRSSLSNVRRAETQKLANTSWWPSRSSVAITRSSGGPPPMASRKSLILANPQTVETASATASTHAGATGRARRATASARNGAKK